MSEADENRLAEKIADCMVDRIYREIGQSIVKKLFWVALIAAVSFAVSVGVFKLPHGG